MFAQRLGKKKKKKKVNQMEVGSEFHWTYNIEIVIVDGENWKDNEPINTICEHNCPSIHL